MRALSYRQVLDRDGPLDRQDLDVKDRADRALRGGKPAEALLLYTSLLRKVTVLEAGVYESWMEGALACYQALGRAREAGYLLLALRRFAEAERCFAPAQTPHEWALCAANQGRPREASRTLAAAGMSTLAAMALESAGDWAGARQLWETVLREDRLQGAAYETALVRFNLGQALRRLGDAAGARRELAVCQRLLEDLADTFETEGDRDRAFECYGVLLRMGRDTGAFENVAEGYLNAIRLLAGTEYRYETALEYYEDFLEYAAASGEWHAAALIAEEAADYSARLGLVYERHYRQRAASLWNEAARHNTQIGGPPEVSENALVAAALAAASAGDLHVVGKLYGALAELPLAEGRRARYAALAGRYRRDGEGAPPAPGFPEHFRRRDAYTDVWRQDLVAWELGGRPVPVLVQLVAERLDYLPAARQALRALLLAADERFAPEDPVSAAELALALGHVRAYEILRPLQDLAAHAAPRVRAAVMTAVAKVPHKRSFALVRAGLADPEEAVRVEARRALRTMSFRSGFEPLVRLFRETTDEAVRHTLIDAIADIRTLEAGLFLVDLVRCEPGPAAELAAKRLRAFPVPELWPTVRRALEAERSGPVRQMLEAVLATAG